VTNAADDSGSRRKQHPERVEQALNRGHRIIVVADYFEDDPAVRTSHGPARKRAAVALQLRELEEFTLDTGLGGENKAEPGVGWVEFDQGPRAEPQPAVTT